ncbi:MAG TPA: CapA family protein [Nakamurella sp.]
MTVALTGDVLVHPPLVQQARTDGGGTTVDFGPMLAAQRDFVAAADLAVCHLETPVAPAAGPFEGYPLFSVPPQVLSGLAGVGYDACTTASNHTLDQGTAGNERTLDALDAAGLAHSGSYRSAEEAAVPLVLDAPGARVAVLSATYDLNTGPPDRPWQVDVIETAELLADARSAKESGAELVLVALHDGAEYVSEPTAAQRQRARDLLADPAVDFVYGHHAHVVQPLERINGKWVAYGLGNTIAAHETPVPQTREGLLLQVSFTLDEAGRWSTTDLAWVASFHPLDPPHRWCALGAGAVCSDSAAADAEVLARTADAVDLLGADGDGARSLLRS